MSPSIRPVRYLFGAPEFLLKDVVEKSAMLMTSSDLTRVKVRRTDANTGRKVEWLFNLEKVTPATDLWVRGGDEIEVPEK